MRSCGNVTVYPGGIWSLKAICENGVIVDTFAKGFPCPFHEDEATDLLPSDETPSPSTGR